jgi:hypothetical protein
MGLGAPNIDQFVQPTGLAGVYVVPLGAVDLDAGPWSIEGRRVTAIAPHPEAEDLLYATTGHPETLSFLPDPYVELD